MKAQPISVWIAIFLFQAAPLPAQTPAKDAVAMVVTELKSGAQGLGTGVFVSADGSFLTAYHVVEGATKITIVGSGGWYKDVTVRSINPSRDLAQLHVQTGRPVPYIGAATSTSGSYSAANLQVYGYPSVIAGAQAQITAKAVTDGYLLSGKFRDPKNLTAIFADPNVELIALDMLIYSGLSGAPLVHNNTVVGVVSGSLSEGGALTWAIPTKYLRDGEVAVNLPAEAIKWPPLGLMNASWKTLRKQAVLGSTLLLALNRMAEADARWATASLARTVRLRSLMTTTFLAIEEVTRAQMLKRGPGTPMGSVNELERVLTELEKTFVRLHEEVGPPLERAYEEAVVAHERVQAEVDEFCKRAPSTPANTNVRISFLLTWNQAAAASEANARRADENWQRLGDRLESLDDQSRTLKQFDATLPEARRTILGAFETEELLLAEQRRRLTATQQVIDLLFRLER